MKELRATGRTDHMLVCSYHELLNFCRAADAGSSHTPLLRVLEHLGYYEDAWLDFDKTLLPELRTLLDQSLARTPEPDATELQHEADAMARLDADPGPGETSHMRSAEPKKEIGIKETYLPVRALNSLNSNPRMKVSNLTVVGETELRRIRILYDSIRNEAGGRAGDESINQTQFETFLKKHRPAMLVDRTSMWNTMIRFAPAEVAQRERADISSLLRVLYAGATANELARMVAITGKARPTNLATLKLYKTVEKAYLELGKDHEGQRGVSTRMLDEYLVKRGWSEIESKDVVYRVSQWRESMLFRKTFDAWFDRTQCAQIIMAAFAAMERVLMPATTPR